MNSTVYTYLDTPIGRLLLAASDDGLRCISFLDGGRPREPEPEWRRVLRDDDTPLKEVIRQLHAYMARELREFNLVLKPEGTPFQLSVWNALLDIPYGRTITYGELARRLGNPKGSRAVGLANGANPIPIVIPCHRVI